MSKGTAIVTISPTGDITVGAKGVSGPDCIKLTAAIENALGSKTSDQKTPEFLQAHKQGAAAGNVAKQGG